MDESMKKEIKVNLADKKNALNLLQSLYGASDEKDEIAKDGNSGHRAQRTASAHGVGKIPEHSPSPPRK